VARRHTVNANQVYSWRKKHREVAGDVDWAVLRTAIESLLG
jgi:transposase-like protein